MSIFIEKKVRQTYIEMVRYTFVTLSHLLMINSRMSGDSDMNVTLVSKQ